MANGSMKRVVNMFAFVGLTFIAFALLLTQVLNWVGVSMDVLNWFQRVGECIAYVVTAIYAFVYVRTKRNVWWWVAYAVALTVIVVMFVLRFWYENTKNFKNNSNCTGNIDSAFCYFVKVCWCIKICVNFTCTCAYFDYYCIFCCWCLHF